MRVLMGFLHKLVRYLRLNEWDFWYKTDECKKSRTKCFLCSNLYTYWYFIVFIYSSLNRFAFIRKNITEFTKNINLYYVTSRRKQVQESKTSFGNPSFGLKTSLIFRLNNISTLIQVIIMLRQVTSAVVYKELQVSRGFQAFKVINKEIQYD